MVSMLRMKTGFATMSTMRTALGLNDPIGLGTCLRKLHLLRLL